MYAVIATGGKQEKVSEGQVLNVERVKAGDDGSVAFRPVLLVDGETVVSSPTALASASVVGEIVGEAKGPKINGFTYKNKTNQRKRWGHRQNYTTVKITSIKAK